MLAYTKASFMDKNGRAVFVASNEYMAKPYAVFKERDGVIHQISKWYFYRGCAERALKKLKAKEQL